MSTPGQFVPGVFSQPGRSTAFEIEFLQNQLSVSHGEDNSATQDTGHTEVGKQAKSSKSEASLKSSSVGKSQDDVNLNPRTPGGMLAKAIQDKLQKASKDSSKEVDPKASKVAVEEKDQPLSVPFAGEGKDGNWASKFTASYDIGSINHRNEQRPDPVWYQVRHEGVLDRPPSWDFNNRPKHQPLVKPVKDSEASMAFMTGLDPEDKEAVQALTSRQRQVLKEVMGLHPEKPKSIGTTMSLNSERCALGKIGRTHVLANEVSCAGESDLLEQDIKAYPKLRYPCWDFEAPMARGPLIKADSLGEPGKYDVDINCVKPVPKRGIGFGKALPRSVCVSTMGYSAPPAILHPEEKRTRGQLPDRSRGKDSVRQRITHVNDFDREMPRPPLLTGGAQTFHDEQDLAACRAIHNREMSYDATTADIYVTHRRDIAPKYDRMLGRGRDSVQGLRALSSDLAVRGSVGLGFVETKSMVEHSVDRRECRAMDGRKEKADIGPKFDFRTVNVHNSVTERMLRGRPLVQGSGLDAKHSHLKAKFIANSFKRAASLPGFDARSNFGGTRMLARNRASVPDPCWAPAELDD